MTKAEKFDYSLKRIRRVADQRCVDAVAKSVSSTIKLSKQLVTRGDFKPIGVKVLTGCSYSAQPGADALQVLKYSFTSDKIFKFFRN